MSGKLIFKIRCNPRDNPNLVSLERLILIVKDFLMQITLSESTKSHLLRTSLPKVLQQTLKNNIFVQF